MTGINGASSSKPMDTSMPDSAEIQRALLARAISDDHADLSAMSAKIDKLTLDVETLMELFKGAKVVVRVVSWVGGVAIALIAAWHALSPFVAFNPPK